MTIREENRDLFTVPQGYYLAHCITADFSLGAGVARKIDEVYNMREKLFDRYDFSSSISGFNTDSHMCQVLTIDNVYNLVLKKNPSKKAKYKKMRCVLENLKTEMEVNLVTKVAMPKIGCGHEGLDWDKVKEIIEEVFDDTGIEILICSLDSKRNNIELEDDDDWE